MQLGFDAQPFRQTGLPEKVESSTFIVMRPSGMSATKIPCTDTQDPNVIVLSIFSAPPVT
jgi:hypothetical protein